MASNDLYFYWYFREQSLIDRASDVFNFLKSAQEILNNGEWLTTHDQIIRSNETENSIQILLNHFKKEIRKHLKVKEVDDSFSEEIGSRITLKSCAEKKTIKLKFNIGASNKNISNCLIIEGFNAQDSDMRSLFILAINHFNVDWASVTNFNFIQDVAKQSDDEFWVGWLLYLSKKIKFDFGKLNCDFEELNNGVLVQITDQQFDSSNSAHVAKALTVMRLLRDNNISKKILLKGYE
jgi:hypothetical protein